MTRGGKGAVAAAAVAADPGSVDAGASERPITNALVDKRSDFLERCQNSHWQFNELRRAHFSTMMMLADLGGPPNKEDLAAVLAQSRAS